MKHIRYTPQPTAEVTAHVTSASINLESGGVCIYLGSDRVDCTLEELERAIEDADSFTEALQSIAARAKGGVVEDAPEPEPAEAAAEDE